MHVRTFMAGPQVAVLTGKIESTMPRPQRTALNEARLCNQQVSVSFDLSSDVVFRTSGQVRSWVWS
jgi:hypothetical protein